jgi:hypothetical protein
MVGQESNLTHSQQATGHFYLKEIAATIHNVNITSVKEFRKKNLLKVKSSDLMSADVNEKYSKP